MKTAAFLSLIAMHQALASNSSTTLQPPTMDSTTFYILLNAIGWPLIGLAVYISIAGGFKEALQSCGICRESRTETQGTTKFEQQIDELAESYRKDLLAEQKQQMP